MSLTKKLVQFQLGLMKPSTFRDSVRSQRIETLKSSLYRQVVTTWNAQRERSAGFMDERRVGYLSIDIDKTESRYILAGCTDGSLEIFDLSPLSQSPKQVCSRIAAVKKQAKDCHRSCCNWVQWYPCDNGMFITSSNDKTVKVWDANEMVVVESFQFNMPVSMHQLAGNVASGPGHSLIAVATDESNVRLADMRTGSQTQHLHGGHKKGVVCVQWSPYDSNVLLSAGRDGRLICWDIRSGQNFVKALSNPNSRESDLAHSNPIIALKFAPAQQCLQLVSIDSEGHTAVWDALTLNLIKRPIYVLRSRCRSGPLKAIGIDFACHTADHMDQNFVFIPSGTNLKVVSLSESNNLRTIPMHMMPFDSCAYRGADYQELYTGSKDKTIGCLRPEQDENPDFMATNAPSAGQKERQAVSDMLLDRWSDSD